MYSQPTKAVAYFKTWAIGASNLYSDFAEDLNREQTIRQPWFINYFEQLTEFTDPMLYALDSFVYYINQNNTLKDNYTNTGNYASYNGHLSTFCNLYDNFIASQLNTISMSWIKITGSDTSFNSSLQESGIGIDEATKYTLTIPSQPLIPCLAYALLPPMIVVATRGAIRFILTVRIGEAG